jgi:hypothetical protein
MSSVTSNFFDDKTPEEIINWMLDKLTEDQIKTCLDQAGIPDTNLIRQPEEPVPVVPVIPEDPGGSGSGSGFEPGPQTTMELDQLRRACNNKLVLIEDISGQNVSFYEFGPDEDGDLKWKKNQNDVSSFLNNVCNEQKISASDEILELDTSEKEEMAPGLVTSSEVPEEVKRLASDYNLIGLPQPLDPSLLEIPNVSEPEQAVVYDAAVSEAIMKQLSLENELKKKYPELHSAGMTKFPVFAHSVSDDGKISYISLILNDDNTFDFRERKNGSALFLTQVKKDLKELNSKIEVAAATGWSRPGDYADVLDTALSNWSSKNPGNQEIYDKILINYNPTRLTQLKNSITTAFGEMAYGEYNADESNTYFSGVKVSPVPEAGNKNVRDLDMNELHERMVTLFGKEYAETHEPFIAYNKFGIKTVQYRKKQGGPKPNLDASHWIRDDVPVFEEFGTGNDDFDLF